MGCLDIADDGHSSVQGMNGWCLTNHKLAGMFFSCVLQGMNGVTDTHGFQLLSTYFLLLKGSKVSISTRAESVRFVAEYRTGEE
jgi:hypothetical protein